jgi:serine/threonine protein kinase
MASLGTGPKLIIPMGFDIVAYSNCFDFCLELGESAERWKLSCGNPVHTTFHLKEDIKKALQIMHSFNFIHGDIKPANIIRVKRSKEKR